MKNALEDKVCPCRLRERGTQTYGQCCGPWHQGFAAGRHAPTAEALMRSRYSAYALATRNDDLGHGLLHYLHSTWHISTAPGEIELRPLGWSGLEVLHAQEGGDAAVVEFKAFYKVGGKAEVLHETSRFVRIDGAWKYIDGDIR